MPSSLTQCNLLFYASLTSLQDVCRLRIRDAQATLRVEEPEDFATQHEASPLAERKLLRTQISEVLFQGVSVDDQCKSDLLDQNAMEIDSIGRTAVVSISSKV